MVSATVQALVNEKGERHASLAQGEKNWGRSAGFSTDSANGKTMGRCEGRVKRRTERYVLPAHQALRRLKARSCHRLWCRDWCCCHPPSSVTVSTRHSGWRLPSAERLEAQRLARHPGVKTDPSYATWSTLKTLTQTRMYFHKLLKEWRSSL
jgi:hypothetical protein